MSQISDWVEASAFTGLAESDWQVDNIASKAAEKRFCQLAGRYPSTGEYEWIAEELENQVKERAEDQRKQQAEAYRKAKGD